MKTCSVVGCGRELYCKGLCTRCYQRNQTRDYLCSVEGCERQGYATGLCAMHYKRKLRNGETTKSTCSVEGCERPRYTKGLCNAHYERARKYGDPGDATIGTRRDEAWICTIDGCEDPGASRGLCNAHYKRLMIHGDPMVLVGPPRGDQHPYWVGDRANYRTLHTRLRAAKGPATDYVCVECGNRGDDTEWSYDHQDLNELMGTGRYEGMPYSVDLDHYQPRCKSCHARFDKAKNRPHFESVS